MAMRKSQNFCQSAGVQQKVRDVHPRDRLNTVVFINRLLNHHNSNSFLTLVHRYAREAENSCNVYKYNIVPDTNIDRDNQEISYAKIATDITSSGARLRNILIYFLDDETQQYNDHGLNHNEILAGLKTHLGATVENTMWYYVAIIAQKKLRPGKPNNLQDVIPSENLGYFYMAPTSADVYDLLYRMSAVYLQFHTLSLIIDRCAPVVCMKEFHGRSFYDQVLVDW